MTGLQNPASNGIDIILPGRESSLNFYIKSKQFRLESRSDPSVMPSDSSGFSYRRSGILALDGPATQLPSPPANHRRVNDPHYVKWPYGSALHARSHARHMPWRLLRRPGSRLHKRPGQALGDPPRNPAATVTLSGKYVGETRRDKVKWTNMRLRMSSQMSPFCHRRS